MRLLGYRHATEHFRVRAATIRIGSGCEKHPFIGIFREKVILGLLFTQRLEPDTVILAFLAIYPA
jgi:hypothetical protein